MTKATMPEPVAIISEPYGLCRSVDAFDLRSGTALITTDQAEAYAAANVRESLEAVEAALRVMYNAAIKARLPENEAEPGWNEICLERALTTTQAVEIVRALIPK